MAFAEEALYDYSKVESFLGFEKNKPGTGALNFVEGPIVKTLVSKICRQKPTIFAEVSLEIFFLITG